MRRMFMVMGAALGLALLGDPAPAQPGWDDARVPILSDQRAPVTSHDATTTPTARRARPIHRPTTVRIEAEDPGDPAWGVFRAELEQRARANPLIHVIVYSPADDLQAILDGTPPSGAPEWIWRRVGPGAVLQSHLDSRQVFLLGLLNGWMVGFEELTRTIGPEKQVLFIGYEDDIEAGVLANRLRATDFPRAGGRPPAVVLLDPETSAVELHDHLATRPEAPGAVVVIGVERTERLLGMLARMGNHRPAIVVVHGWQPIAREALGEELADAWLVPDVGELVRRIGLNREAAGGQDHLEVIPWVLLRGVSMLGRGFALDRREENAEQVGLNGNP